jgi:hypothetical protein
MKLPLPTWTGLGRDLDDLRGDQERLTMPGVPSLGTGLSLLTRAGSPLLIRRIRRGRTAGVAGVLGEVSFEYGDPPFLLLDDREQMDDHVAHDERGLCPTGGIQLKPCWLWDSSGHGISPTSHNWPFDLSPGAISTGGPRDQRHSTSPTMPPPRPFRWPSTIAWPPA